MTKVFRSKITLSAVSATSSLNTVLLFDKRQKVHGGSPIDEFLGRITHLNRLSPIPTDFDPFAAQLTLLGVVAAFESYMRALIRNVMAIDIASQKKVETRQISYGAAVHMSAELLPEALLEGFSFAGKVSVIDALRKILAIDSELPGDVDKVLGDYGTICHLRHCAVHRFGKLGARSAIELGLAEHSELLEKPLALDYAALQTAITIVVALVRTLNNYVFNEILSRSAEIDWNKAYSSNRVPFAKYYRIFADTTSSNRSPRAGLIYQQYEKQLKDWSAKNRRGPMGEV